MTQSFFKKGTMVIFFAKVILFHQLFGLFEHVNKDGISVKHDSTEIICFNFPKAYGNFTHQSHYHEIDGISFHRLKKRLKKQEAESRNK